MALSFFFGRYAVANHKGWDAMNKNPSNPQIFIPSHFLGLPH
jgi:hypothetical protein